MKLENQVCNLELAKKLKELGVKQESYFNWRYTSWNLSDPAEPAWHLTELTEGIETVSAFTVAELGEMLPDSYRSGKNQSGSYLCYKQGKANDINDHSDFAKTEADARAKMLVYLLEKKGINVNDL